MQIKIRIRITLLFVVFVFLTISVFAQPGEINEPVSNHFTINCEVNIPNRGCNQIPNPSFNYLNSQLETFSRGDVNSWQDVNNLTTDINGELGNSMGLFVPNPPSGLTVDYASMLTDNLNESTEGIAAKIIKLEVGKQYLLSFFLSTSDLVGYRSGNGHFTFKILLGYCQNFSLETSGNPNITGETQLIYCKEFRDVGNSNWQQYVVMFEAQQNFDMIIIYPEIGGTSFDGGNYVHFGYPELVPINPMATFYTGNDSANSMITLTACGVTNGVYEWIDTDGFVSSNLNYNFSDSTSEEVENYFQFSLTVPNAIGNTIEKCGDDHAPEIREIAIEMSESLLDCINPLQPTNCNFINQPLFSPDSNHPNAGQGAFLYEEVTGWASINGGTPDLNGIPISHNPPILPTQLSSILGINTAGIGVQALVPPTTPNYQTYYEGISTKIARLSIGESYGLSFFIASTDNPFISDNADFTLKIILTNCRNFQIAPHGINTNIPPNFQSFQEIFCQPMQSLAETEWQQYFLSFTAQDNYDMLVIYAEPMNTQFLGESYIHFLYPELISLNNLLSVQSNGCSSTISTCGVINAEYEWRDPNNNVVGISNQLTVNASTNPGDYTLTLSVPTGNNPLLNNICSDNNPIITSTINIPEPACCGNNLEIGPNPNAPFTTTTAPIYTPTTPIVIFHKYDPTLGSMSPSQNAISYNYHQPVQSCEYTSLCFNDIEYFNFGGSSNYSNGNLWQIKILPGGNNLDAGFFWNWWSNSMNGSSYSYPAGIGSYITIGNTKDLDLFFVFTAPADYTFTAEIRLTNSNFPGEQKSIFISNVSANIVGEQYRCLPNSNTKMFEATNPPGYTYQWVFPTGMNVHTPPGFNNKGVEWDDSGFNYSVTPNPTAQVTVSNIYGCPTFTSYPIQISPEFCDEYKGSQQNLISGRNLELERDEKLLTHIFPNPTSSSLKILSKKGIDLIIIKSGDGKILRKIEVNSFNADIDVSKLVPGSYVLTINYINKTTENRIFLKQ